MSSHFILICLDGGKLYLDLRCGWTVVAIVMGQLGRLGGLGAAFDSWILRHHPLSSGHLHRICILAETVHVNVGLHCFSSLNDCLINFKLNYAICHLPKSLQCCCIAILFQFHKDICFPGSFPYFSVIKIISNCSLPSVLLRRTHTSNRNSLSFMAWYGLDQAEECAAEPPVWDSLNLHFMREEGSYFICLW